MNSNFKILHFHCDSMENDIKQSFWISQNCYLGFFCTLKKVICVFEYKQKNCQILNLENLPEMTPWFHACFSQLAAHFCYSSKLKNMYVMLIRGVFSGLNSTKWDNTNKHSVVEYLREKQLSKWSVLYTASGGCAFTKDRARLTQCKIRKFAKLISRNFCQIPCNQFL